MRWPPRPPAKSRGDRVEADIRALLGRLPSDDLLALAAMFIGRWTTFNDGPLRAAVLEWEKADPSAATDSAASSAARRAAVADPLIDELIAAVTHAGQHEWRNSWMRLSRKRTAGLSGVLEQSERRLGLRGTVRLPTDVRLARIAVRLAKRQMDSASKEQRRQWLEVRSADGQTWEELRQHLASATTGDPSETVGTLRRSAVRALTVSYVVDAVRTAGPKAIGKRILRRAPRHVPVWTGSMAVGVVAGSIAWEWLGPAYRVVTPFFAYLGLAVLREPAPALPLDSDP